MRVSVDESDPGYVEWARHRPLRVLVDGIERSGVVTADEEQRMAVILRRDEAGRFVLNADRSEVVRDVIYGDVAIVAIAKPAGPPNRFDWGEGAALREASTGWKLPPPRMHRMPK